MRGGGGRRLVLASVTLALAVVPAAPAAAKPRRPPEPPRGWVVDRVRFETIDADGFVNLAGTGDVRGALDVVPAAGGVAAVNELSLDDYLRGVAEVPATWPLEALRAQAIAARTFLLHTMQRDVDSAARTVGADICATQACQVYVGMAKERQEGGARWVQAVESTRGQVLLYRNEPILAMYSSSNGGRSVAGSRPYLKAANDPDSARGPYNHWTVSLSYGELGRVLGAGGPVRTVRRVGDAVALDWGPEGSGGTTTVPVADFRAKLNDALPAPEGLPRVVPSTQFTVAADDQAATATLDGRGHGHGIGMSQFGALGKAGRGLRAGDILAAYYGGLRPVTLGPDRLPPTVRVALDTGTRTLTVGGTGRFRVLDGSGSALAVAASGTWRVQAGGRGRVRVVPPADQEAPPSVEQVEVKGADVVGPTGQARFRLGTAAAVRVRVEGATLRQPVETDGQVAGPGDVTVALPVLPGAGRFTVSVLADRGAGRVTSAVVPLVVRSDLPAGGTPLSAASPTTLPRPAAVAWGLLLLVAAAVLRVRAGGPGAVLEALRPVRRRHR